MVPGALILSLSLITGCGTTNNDDVPEENNAPMDENDNNLPNDDMPEDDMPDENMDEPNNDQIEEDNSGEEINE